MNIISQGTLSNPCDLHKFVYRYPISQCLRTTCFMILHKFNHSLAKGLEHAEGIQEVVTFFYGTEPKEHVKYLFNQLGRHQQQSCFSKRLFCIGETYKAHPVAEIHKSSYFCEELRASVSVCQPCLAQPLLTNAVSTEGQRSASCCTEPALYHSCEARNKAWLIILIALTGGAESQTRRLLHSSPVPTLKTRI